MLRIAISTRSDILVTLTRWRTAWIVSAIALFGIVHAPSGLAEGSADATSTKKGFCTVTKEGSQWREKLIALDAKWFYSWGPVKPEEVPAEIEFVPMIWGKYNARRPQLILSLKSQFAAGDVKYLMGFNEPDASTQSNLSVDEAVGLWPRLMEAGVPLASPSCVHPDRDWMKEFMNQVDEQNLRVDYVCVHSYGGPNADALVDRLRKVHDMYGKPLWITEFAVGDWRAKSIEENSHSPERIAKFMRRVIPRLEKLDFVHRYAWYSAPGDNAALGNSALFNEEGQLTELGKIYKSF